MFIWTPRGCSVNIQAYASDLLKHLWAWLSRTLRLW
eukprot:COSAG06_NODE_165_length_21563_cov_22.812989_3_plen_36_part_00